LGQREIRLRGHLLNVVQMDEMRVCFVTLAPVNATLADMTQWEYRHMPAGIRIAEDQDPNHAALTFWDQLDAAGLEGWELVGQIEISARYEAAFHLAGTRNEEFLVFKRPIVAAP
jgi:hypothetical protein